MARPIKKLNQDEMEKLCQIQCTQLEIADWFGVSIDTVTARCKDWGYKSFPDFYKRNSADGKVSIRRGQFKAALKGNPTMLIWLGKQYLGQKDGFDLDDKNFSISLNYTPKSKREPDDSSEA